MLAERAVDASTARFVCAVALASNTDILWEARDTVEGRLQLPPRGNRGFGYDPIFFYPPYGQTLAEVEDSKKAAASHRGKAFQQFKAYLDVNLPNAQRGTSSR